MEQAFKVLANEDIQRIFDDFCKLFDIQIDFRSAQDSSVITSGFNRPSSRYCALIQDRYGKDTCAHLDAAKRVEAHRGNTCVHYKCHAGLTDAILPIRIRDIVVGDGFIGQFRTRETIPVKIAAGAQDEAVRKELEAAFARLPLISKDSMLRVLSIFSNMLDYIITKEMVAIQGDMLAEKLAAHIESHLGRRISRDECAAVIRRSPVTVSQIVRKNYGMTFKQFVLNRKLMCAEKIIAKQPGINLSEVAERLGFYDQFHFSRSFKKYRGMNPSSVKGS